jgi:TonB family protein
VTVSEILEKRLATADAPPAFGPVVSIAAHTLFLVFLIVVSRPRLITVLPVALPVRVVSPASLGARAAAPARTAVPAPTPAPEAPAKPKRVIEKLNEKPVPSASALPDPFAKKKKAPTPAPAVAPPAAGPALELPIAGGNGAAGPAATGLSFGTSVAALDVDFPFAFYVDQMLTLIGANWLKPDATEGTAAVVSFSIQRDGRITDVKLITPSGLGVYDRAAVRAIYGANPLPPLPPEFSGERLGVHLRFR